MKYADCASNSEAYANASLNAAIHVDVMTAVVVVSYALAVTIGRFVDAYSIQY